MSITIYNKKFIIKSTFSFDLKEHDNNDFFENLICELVELRFLNASYTNISILPEIFDNFIKLQYLDLSNNNLIVIPKSIGDLINLKYLDLYDNNIKEIPDEIYNLTNLKKLYLSNNEITNISESLGKLTKLKNLYLSNNNIKILPTSIGNLTKLKNFIFIDNKLEFLPMTILNIDKLYFDETSYNIDNMDSNCNLIILNQINNDKKITNLPVNIQELWITENVDINKIKIPFGCNIFILEQRAFTIINSKIHNN
jgi:Leucine-rich repeat (LRR) protein